MRLKTPLIGIAFLIMSQLITAQHLEGSYKLSSYIFQFHGDSIELDFVPDCYGCLRTLAHGTYTIKNNFLIVQAHDYQDSLHRGTTSINQSDLHKISVEDQDGLPVAFANVILKSKSGKILSGEAADEQGHLTLQKDPKAKIIEASFLGYGTVRFDYYDTLNYQFILYPVEIEETGNIVFKIHNLTEESLKLQYVGMPLKKSNVWYLKRLYRKLPEPESPGYHQPFELKKE